jgi:hypothetical protein
LSPAMKAACSLVLFGVVQAQLTPECDKAVKNLFANLDVNQPTCALPKSDTFANAVWTKKVDGSVSITTTDAKAVCPTLAPTVANSVCSTSCGSLIRVAQTACAGQIIDAATDYANLPTTNVPAAQLSFWQGWFNVMRQVNTLCENVCLRYYCNNFAKPGFEKLTPACSTTTTTVTSTTTQTSTATTTTTKTKSGTTKPKIAPIAPAVLPAFKPADAPIQPNAPPKHAFKPAPDVKPAPQPMLVPTGSMPANVHAALNPMLMNGYSKVELIHPGTLVGVVGMIAAAVSLVVVKNSRSSSNEELERLAPRE